MTNNLGPILTEMVFKGKVLRAPHVQQKRQVAPYPHLGCDAVSRDTNRDAEGTTPVPVTRAVRALPQAFGISAGGRGRRGDGMGEGRQAVAAGPGRAERCGGCCRAAPPPRARPWENNSQKHLPEAGLPLLKEASGSSSSRNLASQHPPRPAAPHTLPCPAGPPAPGRLPATLTK